MGFEALSRDPFRTLQQELEAYRSETLVTVFFCQIISSQERPAPTKR